METEFEAKFYPVEKEKIRQKLKTIGANLVYSERKMKRVIFDYVTNPQLQCHYLRVRDEGNRITFSAKTHQPEGGQLADQKEDVVSVDNFDKTVEIIKLSGLKQSHYQETLRETWELAGAEITIDTWPWLETYSEIEAASEEAVKTAADKLGFRWHEKIITSVTEIFAKVYNLSLAEATKKIAHLTFESNPFLS